MNKYNKSFGSAVDWVEQELANLIATAQLSPGERLDETKLSILFGVSRTPIREALNRLTAQGILVSGDKRGLFVAEYTREELAHIFEAMHEIEIACARIVSQRLNLLTRSEIEVAQANCLKAAESGDIATYLSANEKFHETIYKATGNPYMAEMASEFRRRTGPFRAKKFQSKKDLLLSAQSHQELIADIFSQNSEKASAGMRHHMQESLVQTLRMNL